MRYIAAHIPDEMLEKLSAVADGLKMSRSALIRLALESYLQNPHWLMKADHVRQPMSLRMTITD